MRSSFHILDKGRYGHVYFIVYDYVKHVLINVNSKFVGKYYIVDVGYPNLPGYLYPYKGEMYHMLEAHRCT